MSYFHYQDQEKPSQDLNIFNDLLLTNENHIQNNAPKIEKDYSKSKSREIYFRSRFYKNKFHRRKQNHVRTPERSKARKSFENGKKRDKEDFDYKYPNSIDKNPKKSPRERLILNGTKLMNKEEDRVLEREERSEDVDNDGVIRRSEKLNNEFELIVNGNNSDNKENKENTKENESLPPPKNFESTSSTGTESLSSNREEVNQNQVLLEKLDLALPTGGNLPPSEDQVSHDPRFYKRQENSKDSSSNKELDFIFKKVDSSRQKKLVNGFEEEFFETESGDELTGNKKRKSFVNSLPLSTSIKANKPEDPRKRLIHKFGTEEKLNLIIDLDETLLNSAGVERNFNTRSLKNVSPECIHEIENEADGMRVIVVLRPYYNEFLTRLSKFYNIFAYSHGRWEYVQTVLNMIDPQKKHIRRDIVFKNTGQVGKSTPKLMSALGLVDKEAHKTVILDDQKYIWEVASKKVLPSKKFIPLKDLMPEEKYMKYMLFTKEEEGGKNVIWSLSCKSDPFGLKTYAEYNMVGQKSSQLESLASLLEDIHQEYNLNKLSYPDGHEKLKVENLVEQRMRKVIQGWKISVLSSMDSRLKMFEDLVQLLGGVVVDLSKAHYVIVDAELDHEQRQLVQDKMDDSPLLTVISAEWLIECFFSVSRINPKYFPARSFLCGKYV